MAEFLNKVVASQQKFVTVIDIRVWKLPRMRDIPSMADFCNANLPPYGNQELAFAIVMADNLWAMSTRCMINVITKIEPPMSPLLVCNSMEAADAFLAEEVSKICGKESSLHSDGLLPER